MQPREGRRDPPSLAAVYLHLARMGCEWDPCRHFIAILASLQSSHKPPNFDIFRCAPDEIWADIRALERESEGLLEEIWGRAD